MKMYDTDTTPTPRRQQEQNVQAWMRAAAYAAGTDPGEVLFAATERGNDEMHLAQAVAAEDGDDLALGAALVSMGLIGWREREDLRSAQAENDVAGRLR
jgi:hypothetical protein